MQGEQTLQAGATRTQRITKGIAHPWHSVSVAIADDAPKGLAYGPRIWGKHLFRVRESHVRDHLGALLEQRAVGAARLDLVLRGLALNPAHSGRRPRPGVVLPQHGYESLHDLAREPTRYEPDVVRLESSDDPEVRRLKRKWVGEQLVRLEKLHLVERRERPGRRPELIVLRDDGSGDPFDDPDGTPGNSYVTVLGGVIASGAMAEWKAPELAAYLAAMIAERYERERRRRLGLEAGPVGGGEWFRPLSWFSDSSMRNPTDVTVPFSLSTLERGFAIHRKNGLIVVDKRRRIPGTGRRFKTGERNLYRNRFHTLQEAAGVVIDLEQAVTAMQFEAELAD